MTALGGRIVYEKVSGVGRFGGYCVCPAAAQPQDSACEKVADFPKMRRQVPIRCGDHGS